MAELTPQVHARLRRAGLEPAGVLEVIGRALEEDLVGGVDVTSVATIPAQQRAILDLVARADGTVAGVPVAAAVFDTDSGGDVVIEVGHDDGQAVRRGDVVLTATGLTRDLLTAERTALNILCHLSGIASATAAWVAALSGTGALVRDTRKTTPGLRALEKYAVRCGGGVNHRMSLSDAALIKDNHVVAAGGVRQAFEAVRTMWPDVPIEVEVDSLDQLGDVLAAGADLVLLDNFTPSQMRRAVALNEEFVRGAPSRPGRGTAHDHGDTIGAGSLPVTAAGRAMLEASGGLTLDDAAEVAATGVDYISVGAITHSARILDIGADIRLDRAGSH